MAVDLRKDLPDELDAVIDDDDLDLNQQFILEYIYENDIRSVSERCDRTDLGDKLNLSDYQINRATQALADAGLITIEEFPSKHYYVLDVPTATDHDDQSTVGSDRDASSQDATSASWEDQQQAPSSPPHGSPVASQATTPPKAAVFVVAAAATSGFLHSLGILPQAAALSTLILLTSVYITAYALTLHDITPGQLFTAVEARL